MNRLKAITPRTIWQGMISVTLFVVARDCFASLPKIVRLIPVISRAGKLKIGKCCVLSSVYSRQYITVLEGAVLEIGDHAFINSSVKICAAIQVTIGDYVKIGEQTMIRDTDFHAVSPESTVKKVPVLIGNNVWIGANCMILPGTVIGDHAVIAAGSVVRGKIPARSVAAGIPASVKSTFEAPDDWVRP